MMKFTGSAVVVVSRSWANLQAIRRILREGREIADGDDSHIITAKVLNSEDPNGLWLELNKEKQKEALSVLVPWSAVLMVAISKAFVPALSTGARKTGFLTE